MREEVEFSRNAEAIMIPSGEKVLVPKGAQATITQSLGGAYTLITDRGLMVRVSGPEVEAIGKTPSETADVKAEELTPEKLEEMVWSALKTCYDPEIPVNIVDLGLVYHCAVTPLPQGGHRVEVKMTLTAPGCGMGSAIAADAEAKIARLPSVEQASVEVVFEPPWNPNMMSEAARLELGMM